MLTIVPLFYTGLIVCLNVIAQGGGSNLFPPEQFSTFSEEDIKERTKGSKIVIVSEQVSRIPAQLMSLGTDDLAVHVECHLEPQSLHAVDVCPHDVGNNTYKVDQDRCCLRRSWVGGSTDCLLHSLYTIQRLLGCTRFQSAMHHPRALRDCASDIQPQQRCLDHRHSHTHGHIIDPTNEAEGRSGVTVQYGHIRRMFHSIVFYYRPLTLPLDHFCNPYQDLQSI